MLDKIKFMEMLTDIAEIAKTSNNELTKEEIKTYFGEIELEESHFEHIYAYLAENNIRIEGVAYSPPITIPEEEETSKEKTGKENTSKEKTNKEDSQYLKMYLEDINTIRPLEESEESQLFSQLISGSVDAKTRLMESELKMVVELAYQYKNKGISMEDLIQEGNIGLIKGLESIFGVEKIENGKERLVELVKKSMEDMIDQQMSENDWENTLLAKTNLINEATRYLAKDLGRVANIHELSDYTRMQEEEIKDILNISANAIQVGECEH